jgi:hypothetical protein
MTRVNARRDDPLVQATETDAALVNVSMSARKIEPAKLR